jgi:hypothetical protein
LLCHATDYALDRTRIASGGDGKNIADTSRQ